MTEQALLFSVEDSESGEIERAIALNPQAGMRILRRLATGDFYIEKLDYEEIQGLLGLAVDGQDALTWEALMQYVKEISDIVEERVDDVYVHWQLADAYS